MEHGILVYPPESEGDPWRAVFTENGQRRYRQAMSEAGLVPDGLAAVTGHARPAAWVRTGHGGEHPHGPVVLDLC
jgi:hypothetical protein